MSPARCRATPASTNRPTRSAPRPAPSPASRCLRVARSPPHRHRPTDTLHSPGVPTTPCWDWCLGGQTGQEEEEKEEEFITDGAWPCNVPISSSRGPWRWRTPRRPAGRITVQCSVLARRSRLARRPSGEAAVGVDNARQGHRGPAAIGGVNLAHLVVVVVTRALKGVAPAVAAAVILGVEVAPGQPWWVPTAGEPTVVPTGCGEPD